MTSYSLARSILADPRFSSRLELRRPLVPAPKVDVEGFKRGQPAYPGVFIGMDPPDHTRYRRLLMGQFTVRRMNQLQQWIEQIVDDRLDLMAQLKPPVDLVQEFALPIPSLVICELLGVPYADRSEFHSATAALLNLDASDEDATSALGGLLDFLGRLIHRKRAMPDDDLLSGLIAGGELNDDDLLGIAHLLLIGGHETSANLLALGTFALLSHPDQAEALRSGRAPVDNAVEELLRYLTVNQLSVTRAALEDVDLEGELISAGECVMVSLAAANRDPQKFIDPDELDLERATSGHLAFGHGPHQCIGGHAMVRRRTDREAIRIAAVFASIAVTVVACSSDPGASAEDGDPDTAPVGDQGTSLVVAGPAPPTYDYTETDALAAETLLTYNVIEPLLEKSEDGELQPLLAESFEVRPDGLEYTFTIREAQFHDGTDVSADDVVYSLELNQAALNPAISSPLEAVEAVEKVDDRTVRVALTTPSQRFAEAMSRGSGLIIPEGSADTLAQSPVGSGPFVFEEWRQDVEVSLARFDEYWGELPYFEDITWRLGMDEPALVNAALAGDVDLIEAVRPESIEQIEGGGDMRVVLQPAQPIFLLILNAQDPLFADEQVRQAIAHAIDRQTIVDAAFPVGTPTCVNVNPPDVPWASDACPYPYDPERSRELLAEAGVANLSFEYKSLTDGLFGLIMEVIVAQLGEVGITVKQQPVDVAAWLEQVPAGNYQTSIFGGSQQMDAWVCPGFWTLDCVPEFDELLAQADASTDREEWAELRRQAVELQAERAYQIPLFGTPIPSAVRTDIEGFKEYRSYVELDLRHLRWAE